ncbi:MAG: HlyD family secretion protein [Rhodospirillales bacterium]
MIRQAARFTVTMIAVAVAMALGWRIWTYYTISPWTRDALVRANIVELAPDVTGPIVAINVVDNQVVHKGDVLFVIDRQRFEAAVDQASAAVAMQAATWRLARDNADRDATLRQSGALAISAQTAETSAATASEAQANLRAAEAQLATAQINLARTEIHAPVNGYVTNLTATVGDYATAGKGVLAVVNSDSFYVYGYFMETKLPSIHDGDDAEVRLMAGGTLLTGKVQGAEPRDCRSASRQRVARHGSTRPSTGSDWHKRIPVRIALTSVPPNVRLVAGLSCTVVIKPRPEVQGSVLGAPGP